MKQDLSGSDWLVSPFYPDESGAHYSIISYNFADVDHTVTLCGKQITLISKAMTLV